MSAIEAEGLTRTFIADGQRVEAVRSISFTVASGEIFGFLGRDGAGKTTTLRMLATLLRPDAGTATVMGCDLRRDPTGVRRRIGFVAQQGGADANATVRQELVLQARLHRLSSTDAAARADAVAAMFDLTELMDRQSAHLSGGRRRRFELALGFVHRPGLVVLDEPTAGLDPPSRAQLWRHIQRLREDHGVTVFLTTNHLAEADALCDQVLVLDEGRVVAQDTPEALKRKVGSDVVIVKVPGGADAARAALEACATGPVAVDGETLRFTARHDEALVTTVVRTLEAAEVKPTAIEVTRPCLDDVLLAMTGRQLAGAAPVLPS
ncbi:ABC transporter ATP-binding protein [Crossiella sp. CA-258035]|uniref:ABC transporter ATP-binding protein n=1 Tax=Crossiella sp. CA-258035 TaxID=2981138 RepID=UPI0024BCCF2F|nr:ABC transporter ATP-binding protein [Crossiella sp. CA-258035]WHT23344.1 ABC transporter ATP-binding protein [Crossiella sp. CA-258035]